MNATDSKNMGDTNLSEYTFLQTLVKDSFQKENLLAGIIEKQSNGDTKTQHIVPVANAAETNNLPENETFLKDLSVEVAKILIKNAEIVKLVNHKVNARITGLEKKT